MKIQVSSRLMEARMCVCGTYYRFCVKESVNEKKAEKSRICHGKCDYSLDSSAFMVEIPQLPNE